MAAAARSCVTHRVALFHSPGPLSQSSLAQSLVRRPQPQSLYRTFHSSPCLAVKKPKAAVVRPKHAAKQSAHSTSPGPQSLISANSRAPRTPNAAPTNTSYARGRSESAPRPRHSPQASASHGTASLPADELHMPGLKPLETLQSASPFPPDNISTFSPEPEPGSNFETQRLITSSIPPVSSMGQRTPSQSGRAYLGRPETREHDDYVTRFATATEPTLLFEAKTQPRFVAFTGISGVFFIYVSAINANITLASMRGPVWFAATYAIVALLFSVAAVASFTAPWRSIRRITALPATGSYPKAETILKIQPMPTFGIPIWPFQASSFDVPISQISKDRSFTQEQWIQHEREAFAQAGRPDRFQRWMRGFNRDLQKIFWRHHYFARIRAGSHRNWKLDMLDSQALDNGRALDALVKEDGKAINWYAGLPKWLRE